MSDFTERMQWVCQCNHARLLHNNLFSRIPEGQPIPDPRPDADCRADDCNCVRFTPADFKHDTFRTDEGLGLTRNVETPTGVMVTFSIGGQDLSVMKNNFDLKDFDNLSGKILAEIDLPEGAEPVTYVWHEGSGFLEV